MPATITIKVAGLQELGERLRALNTKVATKSCKRASGAAGQLVKKAAKTNLQQSPSIDTGELERDVIIKQVPKGRTKLTSEHVVVVKKVAYKQDNRTGERTTRRSAVFLEYGTVHMPAEPFMRKALENNVQRAIEVIKQRLTDEIVKAGG